MTIACDDDVLGGEPHTEGTRVAVRHVAARVVEHGRTPAHVADQFDLTLAEVYEALSYYYANIDEIRAIDRENDAAFERVRERSLEPKATVQWRPRRSFSTSTSDAYWSECSANEGTKSNRRRTVR